MKALNDTKLNYLIQKFKSEFLTEDAAISKFSPIDHTHDNIDFSEHTHDLSTDDITGILPESKGGTGTTRFWTNIVKEVNRGVSDKIRYVHGTYHGTGTYGRDDGEQVSIPYIGDTPKWMVIFKNKSGFGYQDCVVIYFEDNDVPRFRDKYIEVGSKHSGGVISGSVENGILTWFPSIDQYWRSVADLETGHVKVQLFEYTEEQLSIAPAMILNQAGEEYHYYIFS